MKNGCTGKKIGICRFDPKAHNVDLKLTDWVKVRSAPASEVEVKEVKKFIKVTNDDAKGLIKNWPDIGLRVRSVRKSSEKGTMENWSGPVSGIPNVGKGIPRSGGIKANSSKVLIENRRNMAGSKTSEKKVVAGETGQKEEWPAMVLDLIDL